MEALMKIFRVSLFNLKRNKREAAAIIFLVLVTSFLMATFAVSITQIDSAFDRSFEETGSADFILLFRADKYRDRYRDILEEEYHVTDVRESKVLFGIAASALSKKGESIAYNMIFADENTERKMENFQKLNALPDDEIEKLSHPVWLPQYFEITAGYAPGETFTFISGGRDYPFTIAGFYNTGLYNSSSMLKCIVSDDDMVLLSAVYEEYRLIAFDTEKKFSYEEYYEKCSAKSNENVLSAVIPHDKDAERLAETVYLNIFLYMSVFLSIVTLISALFLILHKISKDMEEQMVQIGVLEALGYTSRELSLSYICEYILTGGVGGVIGGITAAAFSTVMDTLTRGMMNRDVHTDVNILRIVIVVISIIALVTLFALSRAARVKKLPPVVAFRKGIKTHHFGKNILPLEKMRHSINIRLAFKGILNDHRSNIGTGICMIAAGVAIMFSVYTFDFLKSGYNGLLGVFGMETPDISILMMNGVNGEKFCDEIRQFPEVEKVLLTRAATGNYVEIKGSNQSATAISYADFSLTDNIHPKAGRFPEYDNEIMITAKREQTENRHIGDSIIIMGDVCEKSFIITGIVSAMNNNGVSVYMTEDGYRRIHPNHRSNTVEITLKNEEDRPAFTEKLTALYGASAKDSAYAQSAQGSLEERIRAKADEKMAVLISQYGVTDVDYAIRIGDTVISGNSSRFVIKEISSVKDLAKSQMGPIAAVTKTFSFWAVVFIAVVVAVILGIIAVSAVKRQRREFGIMKSMGYTSRELMIQLTLRILPVTIISSCIAAVLSVWVQRAFWMAVFGVQIPESLPLMIGTAAALVLFCLTVTYMSAGSIRKISVTELMTE